jgi:outer membrane protein
MKKTISLLLCVSGLSLGTLFAADKAAAKTAPATGPAVSQVVYSVDTSKVLEKYYKAVDARDQMQKAQERAQQEINAMVEGLQSDGSAYDDLLKKINNPALTDDAKAKYSAEAQEKGKVIQEKQRSIQEYGMQIQRTLNEQGNTLMELCLADMREAADKVSQERGIPCMIVPVVLYTDPQFDLTDEVVTRLNANKPKGKAASSGGAAPAARTANAKS